jgi:hypothetical protein
VFAFLDPVSVVPQPSCSPDNGNSRYVLVSVVKNKKYLTTNFQIMHMLIKDRISEFVHNKNIN